MQILISTPAICDICVTNITFIWLPALADTFGIRAASERVVKLISTTNEDLEINEVSRGALRDDDSDVASHSHCKQWTLGLELYTTAVLGAVGTTQD